MKIHAILFDADGVIQRPSSQRRSAWRELLGPGRDLDSFLAALFEAERPALEGRSDFLGALSALLTRWECLGTLDDALAAWTMIEVDTDIVEIVQTLRRNGMSCHLATNQESHRAAHMSGKLGYGGLFEREFYSCQMGVMKPAVCYFDAIIKELDLSPANVLFLDDHGANVDSAREAGLHAVEFTLDAGSPQLARTLVDYGIHVV